ncbi:MAG: type VI secretion system ATPase TssH, partial [Proteobacteria bacterium]|nr:type VI secretion system ATPase TssH [Pseudomonadota bacterium]
SNLGSEAIQALTEAGGIQAIKDTVMGVVGQHFRPEFINRVDDIVVFHPLSKDDVHQIAEIQLAILRERLKDQELGIELTDRAVKDLVEEGYDPVYGARPLKRAIRKRIENPLASRLLSGEFSGGDVIEVDVLDGRFVFKKRA